MQIILKPREKADKHNITIENSYWDFAKKYGDGNASEGIRKALYVVYKTGLYSQWNLKCGK